MIFSVHSFSRCPISLALFSIFLSSSLTFSSFHQYSSSYPFFISSLFLSYFHFLILAFLRLSYSCPPPVITPMPFPFISILRLPSPSFHYLYFYPSFSIFLPPFITTSRLYPSPFLHRISMPSSSALYLFSIFPSLLAPLSSLSLLLPYHILESFLSLRLTSFLHFPISPIPSFLYFPSHISTLYLIFPPPTLSTSLVPRILSFFIFFISCIHPFIPLSHLPSSYPYFPYPFSSLPLLFPSPPPLSPLRPNF